MIETPGKMRSEPTRSNPLPVAAARRYRLWHPIAILLILLLATFMRVRPLASESVDGDELFSRRVAQAEWSDGLNMVRHDLVHPPLYYFLLKATLPGHRPASANDIRLLSLITGISSIAVVALLGLAVPLLQGPTLLTALLLALNKTHLFYSQQARSYALYCFLVMLLLLWSVLADRYWRARFFWLVGGILLTATIYTHYVGSLYCAACVAPLLFEHRQSPRRRNFQIPGAAALAAALLLFIPWIISEISVYKEHSGLGANLSWEQLPTFFNLKHAYAQAFGIPDISGGTSLAILIGFLLVSCAFLPDARNDSNILLNRVKKTLALMAFVPPIMLFVAGQAPFNLPVFGERHLLPSLPPILILACCGLWRLASLPPSRSGSILVLVFGTLVLTAFQFAPLYRNWPSPTRERYYDIAGDLNRLDSAAPVYTTWHYGIGEPLAFYLGSHRRIEPLVRSGLVAEVPEDSSFFTVRQL